MGSLTALLALAGMQTRAGVMVNSLLLTIFRRSHQHAAMCHIGQRQRVATGCPSLAAPVSLL
jgi:hypothetical protein